jgi:predicted Zn-dependent protease
MMLSAPRKLAVALAALALLLGCGSSKPPSKPKKKPIVLHTEADDRRAGKEANEMVEAEMGLVKDPELVAYVKQIGQRLARHAPRGQFEYTFQIVDQDAPNAFALPGGFIYVSRGLLALSNSEDELANVLGHEIVHVARRHAAMRQGMMRGVSGPFQFFAMPRIASYGRDQEREADRLGQGLAGLAGYDPQGMSDFLKDLEFTERLRLGTSRLPSFMDTHPAASERVTTSASRARMIAWKPQPGIARDRNDYLRRLDGLVVGTGAAQGVFEGDRFLHPDLDFSMRFPAGWTTRNTSAAVGAISARRDAQVYLEHQGRGDDPQQAFEEYAAEAEEEGLEIEESQPLRIGRFPAIRASGKARTRGGFVRVHLTWIAYGGSIFRLSGVTAGGSSDKLAGVFRSVARSFRPLTPEQIQSIRENRLRIVKAHGGEHLAELARRTHNQLDVQYTAVINDVFANQALENGQLVKVAISEPYRPAAAAR